MHFRHAKEKRDKHHLTYRGWNIAVSVAIYWGVVSIIPIYNKIVFDGLAGDKGFPYPLLTTTFQLGLCAVLLTCFSVWRHFFVDIIAAEPERGQGMGPIPSWMLGDNFWFKVKHTWLIGALFGLKFGTTNWGLQVVPLAPHLLLQATDLMWTVIFAHSLNGERLNVKEMVCCAGSCLGTLLVAWRTHETVPGVLPITINLISPVLLGLCVSTLRKSAQVLLIDEGGPDGKVPYMDAFELTAFKLWISTAVVFPTALYIEGNSGIIRRTHTGEVIPPVWQGFREANNGLIVAAVGGGLLVLIFQVNVTWLSKLTSAISVGIVGGVKIIPQWLLALAFARKIDPSPWNIAGAVILLVSSLLWTRLKYGTVSIIEEVTRDQDSFRANASNRFTHSPAEGFSAKNPIQTDESFSSRVDVDDHNSMRAASLPPPSPPTTQYGSIVLEGETNDSDDDGCSSQSSSSRARANSFPFEEPQIL